MVSKRPGYGLSAPPTVFQSALPSPRPGDPLSRGVPASGGNRRGPGGPAVVLPGGRDLRLPWERGRGVKPPAPPGASAGCPAWPGGRESIQQQRPRAANQARRMPAGEL
jgi:hypothetical protein